MANTTNTCEICDTGDGWHIGDCPAAMGDIKPLADDIPLSKAWKIGRRIYVRCGYKSQLNGQMRELGAKWDGQWRGLWTGTGKADQVIPLVRAAVETAKESESIKESGRWVAIPYDAADIRARAKELGARWDRERKQWAMPTDEALAEISGAVEAREAEVKAAKAKANEQRRREQAESRQERIDRIITRSGRTVTGERGQAKGRLEGRMRRNEAEQRKPQPGQVMRLADGRRVLVIESTVTFLNQDMIADFAPHEQPGWHYDFAWAEVEPTEAEQAEDAEKQAQASDEAEIKGLFAEASEAALAGERTDDQPVTMPEGATITRTAKHATHAGRLVATEDEVWYHHPGHYDDWRSVVGRVENRALANRIRDLVARGDRNRGEWKVQG